MASRKVNNTKNPKAFVKAVVIPDKSYQNEKAVFDFSFDGAFRSADHGDFNNYLKDEKDFVENFRIVMKNVTLLSRETLNELIISTGYRHCHKLDGKEDDIAREVIKRLFGVNRTVAYEQEIGDDLLFQVGIQDGVRIIGTIKGNIFRVYIIDYFHSLDFNQTKNTRNAKKNYKFCPMLGELPYDAE